MIFILPLTFFATSMFFWQRKNCLFNCISDSIIALSLFVLFSTNLLSIFSIVTAASIRIVWSVFFLILAFLLVRERKFPSLKSIRVYISSRKSVLLWCIIGVAIISFIFSFLIVPFNWDSMTYHLARISHWINNKSVGYYFTSNLRQLVSPVLDEYILLHAMLLSGSDRYANILQWASYIISALYIYKTARLLGCKQIPSFLGSFIFLTTPIAFAESMTTQNDLTATLFLWIFLYKCVTVAKKKSISLNRSNFGDIAALGILMGLGYLAKTSVCLPMLFFAVFLVAYLFKSKKLSFRNFSVFGMTAGIFALLIASETFIRWKYYGSIDRSIVTKAVPVGTANPLKLLVNLYKNIASCAVFNSQSARVLKFVGKAACNFLGIDINASEISFGAIDFAPAPSFHCDAASAPIATIAGFVSTIYLVFNKKANHWTKMANLLFFCGFLAIPIVLRWQPWGTRIMLPCISLLCIPIALFINECEIRHTVSQGIAGCLLTLCFLTFFSQLDYHRKTLQNSIKNKDEKLSLYFYNRPDIYPSYKSLIEYCERLDSSDIALAAGGDSYVYPFITYFREKFDIAVPETPMGDDEVNTNSPPQYIASVEIGGKDRFEMKNCVYEKIFTTEQLSTYCVYKKMMEVSEKGL